MKYRCPACGFHIFNRRLAKCESCRAELPAHLLFSPEDIAKLDAQHEQSRKEREERQRTQKERSRTGDTSNAWLGDSSGDSSSGDGGGDGGGCD
jgi:hypothetical protein